LLAEAPPAEAPATVNSQPLDAGLRQSLQSSALATQRRGEAIRLIGARLQAPTLNTADFVVEARERARPPESR
jgi:hypothetical protein